MTDPISEDTVKLFVLDTNILMHDPSCLFRFQEHDLFIPMIVLEELDHNKRGHSDVARSARQASRFLEEMVAGKKHTDIEQGLQLPTPTNSEITPGRLFLQTEELQSKLPTELPGSVPDNAIVSVALALQQKYPKRAITLVTKDINLRIKAAALGISAEEYSNDQVIDDVNLLYSGACELKEDFWDVHSDSIESWQEEGRAFYKFAGDDLENWYPNEFIYSDRDNFHAIVRECDRKSAKIVNLVQATSGESRRATVNKILH